MTDQEIKLSVLFVCMGNICRSPTAEGVFRKQLEDAGLAATVHTDSAGTHAYHVGEGPDRRARAAAERRGYSLEGIRARRVTGNSAQQQREIALAIKNAREMALLPYTSTRI